MRKVIRKRIRRSQDGVNLAADIDAALAIHTGEEAGESRTVVRSSKRVVQGGAGERDQPDDPPSDLDDGPPEEERD